MRVSSVARRYAEALFEAARDAGRIQVLDEQGRQLASVLADPSVRAFFTAPQVGAAQKKAAADKLGATGLDPLLINLLKLLIDKNRMGVAEQILDCYDLLTDESEGVEEVTLVSAAPLEQAARDAIVEQLKRFSAYGDLRVQTEVDPALIGGVVVRMGRNQVIDGSVASRLSDLQVRLSRRY